MRKNMLAFAAAAVLSFGIAGCASLTEPPTPEPLAAPPPGETAGR